VKSAERMEAAILVKSPSQTLDIDSNLNDTPCLMKNQGLWPDGEGELRPGWALSWPQPA